MYLIHDSRHIGQADECCYDSDVGMIYDINLYSTDTLFGRNLRDGGKVKDALYVFDTSSRVSETDRPRWKVFER